MDLEDAKVQLLTSRQEEEQVQVNQRHLIDKILARYSSENTIFRELLQNSNDAFSSKVQILFKTNKSKITGIEYRNNGNVLQEEDFKRLRQIAQGNPDEKKIGFFGVGFYSLFSVCEEPFISSGKKQMGFFWKGDVLYTKSSDLNQSSCQEWTTFWLKLREPMEMIKITEFARFLTSCIGFTANIKEIQVEIDQEIVVKVEKKTSIARNLEFKRSDYSIQNEILLLKSVEMQNMEINVKMIQEIKGFLGFSEGKKVEQEYAMFTRIAIGAFDVKVNAKIEKEMERTTKKLPPKETRIQVIYANYDEFQSSAQTRDKTDVFMDLMPGVNEQGRVFIGFPTFQTTGCSILLQAHLIPTVERESIDFVDPTLKIWNQEILAMGGLLARIVAEDDLDCIQNFYTEMTLDATSEEWLRKKGNHNLVSFTFNHSTPAPVVGRILGAHFYKLSSKPIRIVSTKGILPVTSVRLNDPELSNFFKCIPIIPFDTETYCKELIKRLTDNGTLKKASLEDLFEELAQRPLNSDETVSLFQFWISKWRQQKISRALSNQLMSVLVLADGDRLLPMTVIKHYAMPHLVPHDLPIPDIVMPVKITRHFINPELEQALWGLTEYKVLNWLNFIIKNERFGVDPAFTEKVMGVLSRHYGSLPHQEKVSMSSVLSQVNCVVTRLGMKKPSDSYFKSVNLFEDLPTVFWNNPKSISDHFQKAIGIREHVELQLVFDRLLDLNWNHTQLIKYLTSVQDKLTDGEFSRLSATPMFPKELQKHDKDSGADRFMARDLFAPIESFRSFGLPLLLWNGKWRYNSDEAKFMGRLGLNLFLPLDLLIKMASSSSPELRLALINYFVNNYDSSYASQYKSNDINDPFIPVYGDDQKLSIPSMCYAESGAQVLGFQVLHPDLKQHSQKLGVRNHPCCHELLNALKSNPPTIDNTDAVLNYLSSRQHDFDRDDWLNLRNIKFIPVLKNEHTTWMAPINVYFGKSGDKLLSDQFTYIDFGISGNAFLKACGVKDEPSPIELAQMIIKDPVEVLSERGIENYLSTLRLIATNYSLIKQNSRLVSSMKKTSFLIGIKRREQNLDSSSDNDVTYQLALAKDIFLIDDTVIGQLFNALGAPVESVLEKMYEDLGSLWLSKQVKEVTTPIGPVKETAQARELQSLIHERASLLLYDGQHMRNTQEINPNSDKLLKTLKVLQVNEIEQSRNFLGTVKKQNTTACMLADRASKAFVLYTCVDLDYFDVASALSRIIFRQPRLHDSLLLSTLLSTSLENLRRKGFPVDRILNLKKTMKFAEQINQSSDQNSFKNVSLQMEDERAQHLSSLFPDISQSIIMEELQKAGDSQNALAVAANALAERSLITESPNTSNYENETQSNVESKPNVSNNESPGGMFNMLKTLKKNLGFQTQMTKDVSFSELVSKSEYTNQINVPPNTIDRNINPSNTVELKNQLSNSILRLSTVDESRIHAQVPMDAPTSLPPQKDKCYVKSDSDLELINTIDEVRFYLDKGVHDNERTHIINQQFSSLKRFSLVLKYLAQVFRIDIRTMAIYWDQKGDTVAFNSGLHFPKVMSSPASNIPGSYQSSTKHTITHEDSNTFFYWFMVFCHELAHNFVSNHDADHEFWMSSFAEQYMSDLIEMLKRIGKI